MIYTMNLDDVVEYCKTASPGLIYLAIGCSQVRAAPDQISEQEYPPCVAAVMTPREKKICILIDPELESPPVCLKQFGLHETAPIVGTDEISFVILRRFFEWTHNDEHEFMDRLCHYAMDTGTKLIVQDYTGTPCQNFYPYDRYNKDKDKAKALLNNVLYDFTYKESGCFVDLNLPILQEENGDFMQPLYLPIASLIGLLPTHHIASEMSLRYNDIMPYAFRYYKTLQGLSEPRQWCREETVTDRIKRHCFIHGLPVELSVENLNELVIRHFLDCSTASSAGLDRAAITAILDNPAEDWAAARLRAMRALIFST
jgi:hypothetical protein